MQKKHLCLFAAFCLGSTVAGAAYAQDLTGEQSLILAGKFAFFDRSLSSPQGQACADCHAPSVGWTGPKAGINKAGAVYPGADHFQGRVFGNRKPPTSGYAAESPLFTFDEAGGTFVGGNFWDGRATGWVLDNPAADQATGPFLNPKEMNNTMEGVCETVAASNYAYLFDFAYDEGEIDAPLDCSTEEAVKTSYYTIAQAIALYEASYEVSQYSSRFDDYWRACKGIKGSDEECASGVLGNVGDFLTVEEWAGFGLFVDPNGANCAACHPAPLFTDFTYDNLGVPKNPDNPTYVYEDKDSYDPGLGGFLTCLADTKEGLPGSGLCTENWWKQPYVTNVADLSSTVLSSLANENLGRHKVPTLRNVDLRPDQDFIKAYTHNGVFKSLNEVVHFYNTRDIAQCSVVGGVPFVDCWPEPEVPATLNEDELGNLGLSPEDELLVVGFLKTLSDRNQVPRPQTQQPHQK